MKRRDFIKIGAMASLASTFPFINAFSQPVTSLLPVPPLLEPDTAGLVRLTTQSGLSAFRQGTQTTTWGVNGSLLGPALKLERGKKVSLQVTNKLPEMTTVHWHGMEVPGTSDGGPQAPIAPGKTWETAYTVDQPAATCWFHPHPHHRTGYQVAMGLGGLILIEDDISRSLPLPKTWGVDDIPLIMQDKRLNAQNQIDYALDIVSASVGWFGDMLLTNGVASPMHNAPQGWLRFRLLNGCNARTLNIATSDTRALYIIASDGGFLASPVKLESLLIHPGERFEVLIDASNGIPFELLTLPVSQMGMGISPFNQPVRVVAITPIMGKNHAKLPDYLCTLPPVPKYEKFPVRKLTLSMDSHLDMAGMMELERRYGSQAMSGMHSMMGGKKGEMKQKNGMMHKEKQNKGMHMMEGGKMMGDSHSGMMEDGSMMKGMGSANFDLYSANKINGQPFQMDSPMFDAKKGRWERWIISGKGDSMLHPFHVHGTQFRIISEHGKAPLLHRSGLKDTVIVEDSESEILVCFNHLAPASQAYMAHCHLLEHEDTGMMLSFTVSE